MEKQGIFDEAAVIHCPLCGRELDRKSKAGGGWNCRCGEFVPESLAINSFEGCTHGLNCNCGRARPAAK